MPSKPHSKKRSSEKRKARVRASSSVASSEVVKHEASPTISEAATFSYAYVGRELRRTAFVTGIVLAILIVMAIFLR